MKGLLNKLKKRQVWGIGVFVLCTLLFMSFFALRDHSKIKAAPEGGYIFQDEEGNQVGSGGRLVMRRAEEIYTIIGVPGSASVTWESQNPSVVTVESGANTQSPTLKVQSMSGNAAVNVTIEYVTGVDDDGNPITETETATVTIEVVFSIQEYLNGASGVRMGKVYNTDERRSLIMEQGSQVGIGDDQAGPDFLKLVFGDGTSEHATWESSNNDVIRVESSGDSDRPNPVVQAVGAGPAKLTVSFVDGTRTYTDTIDVYVRPEVTDEAGDVLVGGSATTSGTVVVNNHDKIGISILSRAHPELGAGDKLVWVISKGSGDNTVLVRDSLGNTGPDADEANLVYIPPADPENESLKPAYRIDAKAGVYNLQFYVKGTYTSFEDSRDDELRSNVEAINLTASVKCDFEDKSVILGLDSSYALSEAFNIPLNVLKQNFQYSILTPNDHGQAGDSDFPDVEADGNVFVEVGENDWVVSAKALGKAYIQIKPNPNNIATVSIPGLTDDPDYQRKGYIIVEVTVSDTFSLNMTQATMSVGSTLRLYGIIGSNADVDSSQFAWTVSQDGFVTLSNTNGRYVTLTAQQETQANTNLRVSLAWTDDVGVTRVAHCYITINRSETNFSITPEEVRIEVGASEYLQTSLTGEKDILWISSDPGIVSVEPQTGNVAAKVTASDKTGSVVITAINRENDAYATAIVTVTAPITDLTIDKGTSYTTSVATPYVFMEAVYQPANATSTEMIWESTDTSVATVDEKGMVTVLKIGQTTITVKPVYNPNGVFAQCVLTVKDEPITAIKTDVTTLNMQKGDSYQVTVTLTPENPTDRTLTWTSSKTSVATVTNGKITAVGVGTATIMVQGGNASAVMIEVIVRERLTSISFEEANVEIRVRDTKELKVVFTPSDGVNTNLTFYSSDESTVSVDQNGVITGIDVGKAMITCIAEDLGEYRPITCNVTVSEEIFVATGFTVDPTEQTICVGDDFTILPIFTPAETTNQQVTYSSLDDDIASVTEDGVVTGVAPGKTVIVCTAVETNLTETCQVTVEEAVKFSLNPSTREIAVGKSFTIKKVTQPSNIDTAAIWQTSNSKVASITASGKVTGKKIGSCTITCTLKKYNQSATCKVKVAKLKSTVKLDKSSIRMNLGSTYRLTKTVTSNNSTLPSVKFTSSNKKVASVGSTSGKITAKKIGSAVITAKTTDSVHATAKCKVTVIRRATSVSLNKTYAVCYIGSNLKLKATVKPANASIQKVKWSSSDQNIAVVNSSGKVTGYAAGDVYITATTTDGSNKSSRCLVKVMDPIPATNIMVAQQKLTMQKGDTTQLSYTILPDNQTDTIKMASDNNNVASVTNAGKVTAKGTGTATITITSSSGITATVQINVVALNKTSLRMRQYDTETLMVLGTTDAITWYSANNRIATVENGKITGKSLGTTYIYAYVDGCRMTCTVQIVSVNS